MFSEADPASARAVALGLRHVRDAVRRLQEDLVDAAAGRAKQQQRCVVAHVAAVDAVGAHAREAVDRQVRQLVRVDVEAAVRVAVHQRGGRRPEDVCGVCRGAAGQRVAERDPLQALAVRDRGGDAGVEVGRRPTRRVKIVTNGWCCSSMRRTCRRSRARPDLGVVGAVDERLGRRRADRAREVGVVGVVGVARDELRRRDERDGRAVEVDVGLSAPPPAVPSPLTLAR